MSSPHVGEVGVLLADGTEPGPVYFDLGSGSYPYESTDWWAYDGSLRRPTATTMRGRCACGWRGARTFPLDWQQVDRHDRDAYDTSGPLKEWEEHLDDVAARTLPLPGFVHENGQQIFTTSGGTSAHREFEHRVSRLPGSEAVADI
ncbi:hypothetical protein ACFT6Z_34075 [Streptomyces sp. NPDC057131]|uniref:hypothetical protein n=1 Tax=Streptomyces sp. NPDC057131 TaxID=3346027 RepID=UPI00362F3D35